MFLKSISIRLYDAETGDLLVTASWHDAVMHGYKDASLIVQDLLADMFKKLKSQSTSGNGVIPRADPSLALGTLPSPASKAKSDPISQGKAPEPSIKGPQGKDAYQAERLPEARSCHPQPQAVLSAKGPGFETYSLTCSNGDALAIRCEYGNCRVLR